MADWYVRATNGLDTNAGTSHALAFQTLQKAIDSASGGDTININDEAAIVLSAAIGWASGWSGGTSYDAYLRIEGYTATKGDGGIGEVNGNDAAASIFSTTSIPSFVILKNLLLHNTTSYVIDPTTNWTIDGCELHSAGANATIDNESRVLTINSYIHDPDTAGVHGVNITSGGSIFYSRLKGFDGHAIRMVGIGGFAIGNIIDDLDDDGIEITNDLNFVLGNTINGNSVSGKYGILNTTTTAESHIVLNNIITNFGTGGSGGGVKGAAGHNFLIAGFNHFHNNSEGNEIAVTKIIDYGNNQTTDPTFTNAAGGDYSVGTNAKAKGFPSAFKGGGSTSYVDTGAVQRMEAIMAAIFIGRFMMMGIG